MLVAKRGFALFLYAFAFCMAVAALANNNWVDQRDSEGGYGVYHIGLKQWQITGSATLGGDCPKYDLNNLGETRACTWSEGVLGLQKDWQSAGEGALGIGTIAIILMGFGALATVVNLIWQQFSKVPAALLGFLSGLTFIIGALVYDGMRPSWSGDMGYNHPMGLYLAAGLLSEIAAIILWSADFTGQKA